MNTLFKTAREQKGLRTREVAQLLGIDQALISKFESGTRKPTRDQLLKLAQLLQIDLETIVVLWLKDKIIHEIGHEKWALKALILAQEQIKLLAKPVPVKISEMLASLLDDITVLKNNLPNSSPFETYRITKALEIDFTFESNHLEGNTMTREETDLIINKGFTIAGKSMREHLEVINHHEAIGYIKDLTQKNNPFTEKELLALHQLITRGIVQEEAGKHQQQFSLEQDSNTNNSNQIKDFFIWFESDTTSYHPIIFAAQVYERFSAIQAFANGNEKIARLMMNYVLLLNGYILTNIPTGEKKSQSTKLQSEINSSRDNPFYLLLAQAQKKGLEQYSGISNPS